MLNKTALSLLALSSSDEEKLLRAHLLVSDAKIRLMENLGWSREQIALNLGCREPRIRDLLENKTYIRVAG